MPPLDIRPATTADLPDLLDLYAVFDPDGSHLPIDEAERLFRRMQSYPNYTVYAAWEGEKIIGTFALLVMDNLAHNAPSQWWKMWWYTPIIAARVWENR